MWNRSQSTGAEMGTDNIQYVRAAEYVRMSTDHQKYSIANQSDAIRAYAARRGMTIVRTYADEGKSGLNIDGRRSLQQLIEDVQKQRADFTTILVYDVSRWGRFQDADESAYYEFICKQAGIRVEYCAEHFENDGSPTSTIVKAIKRLMAAEYSRDLSHKIFSAQSRMMLMGFRVGGHAGYGLRRLLVTHRREAKGILAPGDWKSLTSDRVVLVPGPPEEADTVRRIFDIFVRERKSEAQIATILNGEGIVTDLGRQWRPHTVGYLLRSEKYIGNSVWNRHSSKLGRRTIHNGQDIWLRADGVLEPIVERSLFDAAQAIFRERKHRTFRGRPKGLSKREMIDRLRSLFKEYGYLSHRLIDTSGSMPSHTVYAARFDSLQSAYQLVGYDQRDYRFSEAARRLSDEEMLNRLRQLFRKRGRLSNRMINETEGMPSSHLYRRRFGSLFWAYELVGFKARCRKHPARARGLSNDEMLKRLRRLLKEKGRLSSPIINGSDAVPSSDVFRARFGSLMQAYRLIGLTGDRYQSISPRPRGLSREEMLEALRKLWRSHGYVSLRLIEKCEEVPSTYTYAMRFGSIREAYRLIGYNPSSRVVSKRP
ncbi:MAG TPA: recombinase family protein [Pseudolabrys sp.]|jgi:DNA invertase Pin-like site-specific DNA recombinase